MSFSRDDFFTAGPDVVPARRPALGKPVWLRRISALDLFRVRDTLQAPDLSPDEQEVRFRCTTLALGLCDEAGERIFSDADIEAMPAWGTRLAELWPLIDEIEAHNRTKPDDAAELKKKSSPDPSSATTAPLAEISDLPV